MTEPVRDYESMTPRQRRSVTLVEYECDAKNPCRLMTVWQDSGVRYWYLPPYKITEAMAVEETAESARQKRTTDGMRRWNASAGSLDDLFDFAEGLPAATVGLGVNCKHLRNHVVSWRDLQTHVQTAVPGKPRWIKLP